jgi:hypothetical protein
MADDRTPPEPEESADDPKPEGIAQPLGDEAEVRATLNRLEISYDLPLETFAEIARKEGHESTMLQLKAAEELAKVMRLYPDKNRRPTVVETTGEIVRVYLPDNGRDDKETDDGKSGG